MHINCIGLLMPRSVIIRAASIIDTDTDADILVPIRAVEYSM